MSARRVLPSARRTGGSSNTLTRKPSNVSFRGAGAGGSGGGGGGTTQRSRRAGGDATGRRSDGARTQRSGGSAATPKTAADVPTAEEMRVTKAQQLAEMRGKLRLLKSMAAGAPHSAGLARRVARMEYKLWKFTLSQADVPRVQEAYKHALAFTENQHIPEMWQETASAYISCVTPGVAWRGVAWRGVRWRHVCWWHGTCGCGMAWRGVARRGVCR